MPFHGGWNPIEDLSNAINDVGTSITNAVDRLTDDIGNFLGDVWHSIGYPVVEAIFNVLGFNDEDIYPIQVSTVKLLESEPSNGISLAVLRSIRENADMIPYLQHFLLTGPVNSLNLYTQYGRDTYTHGLPETVGGFRRIDNGEIDSIITGIEGEAITLVTSGLGFPPDIIWVKYYLQENESYTEDDSEIFKSPDPIAWIYDGFTEDGGGDFIVDLQRDISGAGTHDGLANAAALTDSGEAWTTDEWNGATIFNTTDGSSGTVTTNSATVITATLSGGTDNDWDISDAYTITRNETTTLGYPISPSDPESYYHAKYTLDSDPSYEKFWTYKRSLGTYADLEGGSATGIYHQADMVPIVPLRKEFVSVNSDKTTQDYKTSKRLLDIINLDIEVLIEQIETNPDISSIEDVFVIFGINLYTETEVGKKALYSLFYNLYLYSDVTKAEWDAHPVDEDPIYNTFRVTEQSYNTVIKYDYISFTQNTGVIAEMHHYVIEVVVLDNTVYEEDEFGEVITQGAVNSYVLMKFQDSASTYFELKIHGMFSLVNIFTTAGFVKNHVVELSTDPIAMNNFIIPLPNHMFDGGAIGGLTPHDGENLIYESMHMVMYASDHIHLEFYETPTFLNFVSFVLQVVAIVILVWSLGTAKDVSAALWIIAKQILIQYALTLILTYLLTEFADDEFAKYLIIAGYIYASSLNASSSNMQGAEALLFAVNAGTQAITIDLQLQQDQLQTEIDAFTVDAEEREEELEKARDLLPNNSGLELWELATYLPTNPYEDPNSFYIRTTHETNPGVLVLSQIENFHANLLVLPELDVHSFDPVSAYADAA